MFTSKDSVFENYVIMKLYDFWIFKEIGVMCISFQKVHKCYARYVFDILFLSQEERTNGTRKNVYYFASEALLALEMFKF